MDGIGDEPVAGINGKFRRLGFEMRALGPERIQAGDVEPLEDVEKKQRRRTLAVWRVLHDFKPAILGRDGVGIVAGCAVKVVLAVGTTKPVNRCEKVLGDFPFVKARASLHRDAAQDLGLSGRAKKLPRRERPPRIEIELPRRAGERGGLPAPVGRDARRYRNAGFGIMDRGRQRRAEPCPPPIPGQSAKGVHGAGHGDRVDGAARNRGVTLGPDRVRVKARRRPARAVEGDDPVFARRVQQDEAIAPETRHRRFADAEQNRPGDGRVDGVATGFEGLDRDLCGEGMRCCANSVPGKDGRSTGKVEISHGVAPSCCAGDHNGPLATCNLGDGRTRRRAFGWGQ